MNALAIFTAIVCGLYALAAIVTTSVLLVGHYRK